MSIDLDRERSPQKQTYHSLRIKLIRWCNKGDIEDV